MIGTLTTTDEGAMAMLEAIHMALGIPAEYPRKCGLPEQPECTTLVSVGEDAFGRPAQLDATAADAWSRMQQAAAADGITLLLVSAYRSHDYQRQLIQRKLDRGQFINDILQVNAAPGYSEHHSGRALDIGCEGFAHLEEEFEESPAFDWLQDNAKKFGFRLSFPRFNPYGVMYEPWHWYYIGTK
jgi:D-alanyl-D-alanine carboxypeptidase